LKYVVTALEFGKITVFEVEARSVAEARIGAIRELRRSMKAGQVVDVQPISAVAHRRRLDR
jgi:hypothetical protein